MQLGNAMAAVRITDAPLTIEDSLAVANSAQVELAEGVRAKIADGPAVMDRALTAGKRRSRPHGPTAQVGHGKDTRPGTGSFGWPSPV